MTGQREFKHCGAVIRVLVRLVYLSCLTFFLCFSSCNARRTGIEYMNPRVYNVDFTFELHPDHDIIDRENDLRLWLPVPGEWDSQRAVKIISVEPPPHAEYTDPEFGNRMFFWNFAKEPQKTVYVVNLKYRLESFELQADIDPNHVGAYNKADELYTLYTRSTNHIEILPEIEALAHEAVGDEENPYLRAKRIHDFVVEKVRYKWIRPPKRVGTRAILNSASVDEVTGERYYEGACVLMSEFFVALCRAAGIPARTVVGMTGWDPWMKKEDLKLRNQEHTQLSDDGLAAARLFGPFGGHKWAEFYLPNYGWIPADPTRDQFATIGNYRMIFSKGTDVLIGPDAPQADGEGYGDQWIPLQDGRAKGIGWGVWNLARVRVANAKVVHRRDPFPADALARYPHWESGEASLTAPTFTGRGHLRVIDKITRNESNKQRALMEAYNQEPRLRRNRERFVIHMFRRVVGDEAFIDICKTYMDLRLSSRAPVSTLRFQEIAEGIYGESLDWYFSQWFEDGAVPQLRLANVETANRGDEWMIQGNLCQLSDRVFQFPVELEVTTDGNKRIEHLWVNTKEAPFEFKTQDRPIRITVDPGFDLLKIQRMPPILYQLWDGYPKELLVVYGTLSESQANQRAAEEFNREFLGLSDQVIKPDIDVSEEDLQTQIIVLFGRPEANLISQRFVENFPIRFNGSKFTYEDVTYDKPTQGVAQVIEKPWDHQGLIVMYAGLSGEATQRVCDKSEWRKELEEQLLIDVDASFVIFDQHERLVSGEWKDFDENLVWVFNDP